MAKIGLNSKYFSVNIQADTLRISGFGQLKENSIFLIDYLREGNRHYLSQKLEKEVAHCKTLYIGNSYCMEVYFNGWLDFLKQLPNLEEIFFENAIIVECNPLFEFPYPEKLKRLSFQSTGNYIYRLDGLEKCINLEELELIGVPEINYAYYVTKDFLEPLQNLTKLKKFTCDYFEGYSIEPIQQLLDSNLVAHFCPRTA